MSVLAFLILLLPGLAWWAWFGKQDRDPLVALAQITGISLAAIILLAEIGFLIGVTFSTLGIILLAVLFTGLAVAGLIRRGFHWPHKFRWYFWIGLPLFGLTVAWRLFQARGLLLPNWVDSQHHYLIVRTILENGGLPETLAPYLDMPFYYHYGFHAVAAFYTAISGLEIGQGMIVIGQVLNALIGLSVYALGKTLWKDWRPAAAAALLVTFVTRMPAYYLSWGRYTLTVGMIFLPLAMSAAVRMLRKPHRKADIATLALLTTGVLLSHYFAALLLAIFLVVLAGVYFVPRLRKMLTALANLSGIITGTLFGLLLALPWLLRVAHYSPLSSGIESNLGTIVNGSSTAAYIWKLLGPASNYALLIPAVIGLALALTKKIPTAFSLWSLILAIFALPWTFNLQPFRGRPLRDRPVPPGGPLGRLADLAGRPLVGQALPTALALLRPYAGLADRLDYLEHSHECGYRQPGHRDGHRRRYCRTGVGEREHPGGRSFLYQYNLLADRHLSRR